MYKQIIITSVGLIGLLIFFLILCVLIRILGPKSSLLRKKVQVGVAIVGLIGLLTMFETGIYAGGHPLSTNAPEKKVLSDEDVFETTTNRDTESDTESETDSESSSGDSDGDGDGDADGDSDGDADGDGDGDADGDSDDDDDDDSDIMCYDPGGRCGCKTVGSPRPQGLNTLFRFVAKLVSQ